MVLPPPSPLPPITCYMLHKTCTNIYKYIYIYICIYIYKVTQTNNTYIPIYIFTCIYTYIYIHTYTDICTYVHEDIYRFGAFLRKHVYIDALDQDS